MSLYPDVLGTGRQEEELAKAEGLRSGLDSVMLLLYDLLLAGFEFT